MASRLTFPALVLALAVLLGAGCGGGGGSNRDQAPPVVSNIVVTGTGGDITVTFDLSDVNDDMCSVVVHFRGGSASAWMIASTSGQIAGLAPGASKNLKWRSATDQAGQNASNYEVRVTPVDIYSAGTADTSSVFSADNSTNSAPSAAGVSVGGSASDSTRSITFNLADGDTDDMSVVIEYRGGTQTDWTAADIVEALTGLTQAGSPHSVTWNASTDVTFEEDTDFEIRVTPNDGTATGAAATSTTFEVDQNTAPTVSNVAWSSGAQGDITLTYDLTDPEGDACSIAVSFMGGSVAVWTVATDLGQSIDLAPGIGRTVVWASEADQGSQNASDYQVRITPSDADAGTAAASSTFSVDNTGSNAPTAAGVFAVGNAGDVSVDFSLSDLEDDACTVTLQYRGGTAGTNWTTATATGTLTGLVPSAGPFSVTWTSGVDADGEDANDFQVRVLPNDGTSTGVPADSANFQVDNNDPPVLEITSITGGGGDIAVMYNLTDAEDDPCSLSSIQFKGGGVVAWTNATIVGSTTGIDPGTALMLTWDSDALADAPEEDADDFQFRFTPADNDAGTADTSDAFTVDNNETPADITLDNADVDENQAPGTAVGNLTTTDTDPSDTHTYELAAGTGATDNSSFQVAGTVLQTAVTLDFEAGTPLSIRLRTTDSLGNTYEKVFSITVNDVNDSPTDIALDNSSVIENQPVGTVVGNLTTTDQDAADTHAYSLVAGAGDTGNASFQVVGGQLQTAAVFDFAVQSLYSIRLRTTDSGSGNLTFEEIFTITITP